MRTKTIKLLGVNIAVHYNLRFWRWILRSDTKSMSNKRKKKQVELYQN